MSTIRTTHRWRGIVAVALLAGGAGLLLKRPSLLLLATAGVALAVYPRLTRAPDVSLDLDRTVGGEAPEHGEVVAVEVTVTNTGQETIPDLRIVDGVPPMLAVDDGTPRHATVLRPGKSTTFSYRVRAKHGIHRFEPATVVARDVAGAQEVETTVASEDSIECKSPVPEVPLRQQTGQRVGDLVTDEGGTGIEFHRTRSYRKGDALRRVDWRRFAKTGELATVEYREERSTTVMLCLDAREVAHRNSAPGEPHAVSYSVGAIEQTFGALLRTVNTVGIAAVGPDFCWLSAGAGADHAARGEELLATHPALSAHPPDGTMTADRLFDQVDEVRKRLRSEAQVVLFSPLPDDEIVQACLQLEANGHAVTVVTPDVTTDETVGGRLARVERRKRISSLRERGVRTVEWKPDRPLGTALMQAQERWSA
jgi:uncharacterized protein (DUF58 family)